MDRVTWTRMIGLAVVGGLLLTFWDSPALWPLKILVVMFHELGHAAAALLTGGEVLSIGLSPAQGGVTHTSGGWRFGVLNAGYLGSLSFGMTLLFLGRRPRSASVGLGLLAVLLVVADVLWVRPVAGFASWFVLATALTLGLVVRSRHSELRQWLVRGLGVFSVLYALWDIRCDVFGAPPGVITDATLLAELTWIPAPVWGAVWLTIGVATLIALRRWLL